MWAAGVDMTDASLRPECSTITRIESLRSGWVYPTLMVARSQFIGSYDEYLEAIQPYPSRPPIPVRSGRGLVWSEEHGAAFLRSTIPTPYGWYTFDIELMEVRPVDTAPDSWDTINLWGDQVQYSATYGRSYYANLDVVHLPPDIEPWPAFDPWVEVLSPGSMPTVPGPRYRGRHYFEPVSPLSLGISEYMRITCK